MTCEQCKYITACMAEVDSLGQVFDPNYDGEHRCTDFAPFTNADHIRSMSDEELATMLKDYKDCSKNCVISNGKNCYQICEEESVLLKWLKQPFEGE